MNKRRAIVWFRNDLRLHDNEAMVEAIHVAHEVIFVFVLDDRLFKGKTSFGLPKLGKFRRRFILESLEDLRSSLKAKNSNLIVRQGITEEIIPELCREHKVSWVHCNRERTQEEVLIQDTLESNLWTIGVEMRYSRGKMLYHTADLPFPITQSPTTFTAYRKEVEKFVPVRKPFDTPNKITSVSEEIEEGIIPSLKDYGIDNLTTSKGLYLKGGESEALAQMRYYFEETKLVKTYKKTRNQSLGRDYSSKFSAYLSKGCLSPKLVYHELKKFEKEHGSNESTYWLVFELLWRDFFRLMAKRFGNKIFLFSGLNSKTPSQDKEDQSLFNIWKEARTGVPYIDANLTELNETGFMSNRGRQNVASFLIYDMGMNWLMGAEYFESLLIDYDPCSNYGNWAYIAGVGTDPKQGRHFSTTFQSQRYDADATFIKYWLPQLDSIKPSLLHHPSMSNQQKFQDYGITLGKEYPAPILVPT